jgi:hypothetical protein
MFADPFAFVKGCYFFSGLPIVSRIWVSAIIFFIL